MGLLVLFHVVVLVLASSVYCAFIVFFFFFQAEDGIRDLIVTGVQTCALPISSRRLPPAPAPPARRAGSGPPTGRWSRCESPPRWSSRAPGHDDVHDRAGGGDRKSVV